MYLNLIRLVKVSQLILIYILSTYVSGQSVEVVYDTQKKHNYDSLLVHTTIYLAADTAKMNRYKQILFGEKAIQIAAIESDTFSTGRIVLFGDKESVQLTIGPKVYNVDQEQFSDSTLWKGDYSVNRSAAVITHFERTDEIVPFKISWLDRGLWAEGYVNLSFRFVEFDAAFDLKMVSDFKFIGKDSTGLPLITSTSIALPNRLSVNQHNW